MTRSITCLVAVLAAACFVPLGGCDDDEPFDPWSECGDYCIGKGGGSVAIDDPDHSLYGVRVDVPAGAWDRRWSVYPGYETTFTTPNFPDGLEGYAGMLTGSLNLEISDLAPPGEGEDPPDSLYMEITFPLRELACEPGELFTVYRYDEAVGRWRLELPDARTDSTITVHTYDHAALWTWGIVNPHEADWDLYIEPVMADLHTGDFADVELTLRQAYLDAVNQSHGVNCTSLALFRSIFAAMNDASEAAVVAHQDGLGGICRVCDVTTHAFYAEYLDYIVINIQAWLIEFFLVENGPDLIVQIYGIIRMCEKLEELDDLACDYECFWSHADSDFTSNLALYLASGLVVRAIDYAYATEFTGCSP